MLKLVNVTKKYDNKNVLLNVNVVFQSGSINIISGKNGSGKSTLFDCIVRPKFIDDGCILLNEHEIDNLNIRRKIFYLPSYPFIDEDIRAIDYLEFVSYIYTKKTFQLNEFIGDLVALNLENNMQDFINTFSLGMKKKLYFIASLISCADYLIYDELFNGIDDTSSEYIINLLKTLKIKNKCILIATHNIKQILDIADSFFLMENNTISIKH